MFSTTKTVTHITKVEGGIPSRDLIKAICRLYNLPVSEGELKVTVRVPYEEWDLLDCDVWIEWTTKEDEEIVSSEPLEMKDV